jgi:polyhydroxybutyrate depolymerase
VGSGYEWKLDDDARLLSETIATLSRQFPGVHRRVCMTGMSGGARMSSHFAASHPDQVLLLGAVAGLRAPARPSLGQPVRVVAFHGTADRINPFAGGSTSRWDESVLDAAKAWATAEGQPTEPHVDEVAPALTRLRFGADGDPGAVTLWV